MIAVIDYDVGNLGNLKNALDHLSLPNQIVTRPEGLERYSRILLPGVGAFGPAMDHLRRAEMEQAVRERVAAGTPFLGVCVGMQLLLEQSLEDGVHQGLGFIPGQVVRFKEGLKVPQIGWNTVAFTRPDPLLEGIADNSHFYFVHSYHAVLAQPEMALGITDYGGPFPAIVRSGQVWGVQFHPEKSQAPGLRLLKNFAGV